MRGHDEFGERLPKQLGEEPFHRKLRVRERISGRIKFEQHPDLLGSDDYQHHFEHILRPGTVLLRLPGSLPSLHRLAEQRPVHFVHRAFGPAMQPVRRRLISGPLDVNVLIVRFKLHTLLIGEHLQGLRPRNLQVDPEGKRGQPDYLSSDLSRRITALYPFASDFESQQLIHRFQPEPGHHHEYFFKRRRDWTEQPGNYVHKPGAFPDEFRRLFAELQRPKRGGQLPALRLTVRGLPLWSLLSSGFETVHLHSSVPEWPCG